MVRRGQVGATIGKPFSYVFMLEKSSPEPASQFQSNFIQIILALREFKFVQIKGQVLFQRGDNHKNRVGVI
jgi:hypothetical protein